MSSPVAFVASFLIQLIFPPLCCHCGKYGSFLCTDCYELIEFSPLPFQPELENCQLESVHTLGEYKSVLQSLIWHLKYQNSKDVSYVIARLMYTSLPIPDVDGVTFAPLHPRRLKDRGFNQSEEIAKHLAKLLHKPCLPLLMKMEHTPQQALTHDKSTRLTQLTNAFTFNMSVPEHCCEPIRTVLLIDDVTTTGTTLNECAKVLRKAGIRQIHGAVVAHG